MNEQQINEQQINEQQEREYFSRLYKDNDIIWGFRKLLYDKRRELGISVRELGAKAGVSYTVIYDLEQRNVLPKMETLVKIANALGYYADTKVSPDELSIIFRSKQNYENETTRISKSKHVSKQVAKQIAFDVQLSRLLSQKGLYTKEIDEINEFINFKLSQHTK